MEAAKSNVWVIILAATFAAIFGARPFAGSWNDGSRFACIESLVDRDTYVIDDSIFVRVPPASSNPIRPYRDTFETHNNEFGTQDKLRINGLYYSDKSPVPNLLGAVFYRLWRECGGTGAAERPDLFCRFLTIAVSGAAYLFSVVCVYLLTRTIGLAPRTGAIIVASFAFATIAPTYARQFNGHILQLAPVSGICLVLARASQSNRGSIGPILLGIFSGFGYTSDLGIGPCLVLATFIIGGFVYRSPRACGLMLLAAAPWIALHHIVNYRIGETISPANSVAEYLRWPGSPFDESNITSGAMKHSWQSFLLYAPEMLFGKQGFVTHNLPLWLAPGSIWLLIRDLRNQSKSEANEIRTAILFTFLFCGSGWLLYAAGSTNMSGRCCSIRWFVPFLAPGFWLICLLMRHRPEYTPDLLWLTSIGTVMGGLMWSEGPWAMHMVPGYWGWLAVAAIGWAVVRRRAVLAEKASNVQATAQPLQPVVLDR